MTLAIGMLSGRNRVPSVWPKMESLDRISGSSDMGTSKESHSCLLQVRLFRSIKRVREAFEMSVACDCPFVRRHSRYVSIVPKTSRPALARDRAPRT